MARNKTQVAAGEGANGTALSQETPKSVSIASRGIRTAGEAAGFLSALIGDVMSEAVPVRIANSGINAMGKLLKVAELQQKYGKADGNNSPELDLVPHEVQPRSTKEMELIDQLIAARREQGVATNGV